MSPAPRIGLVAHPTRDVEGPLGVLIEWAQGHGAQAVQIPFHGERRLLEEGRPEECDLIVAIGGDGTTLAAIRRAAAIGKPVLGVACGSLGVLTTVEASAVGAALERFTAGDWLPRALPGLRVRARESPDRVAFNDVALVRAGPGQLRVAIRVDGTAYVRLAGDGCLISTPAGSSAYTIAAGGPLLAPDLDAFVLTPLPTHGGFQPPLVLGGSSVLELDVAAGYGGGRIEFDGAEVDAVPEALTVSFEAAAATVVAFSDQEPQFVGLRRRGILTDSPRILADDARG